ncbi:MAG: hypothetical protein GC179_23145 [Anaerolineaceae bacterium]|nr:hypothetical protein [Anaerolineaceae bacterium]
MPTEIDLFREFIIANGEYSLGKPASAEEIAAFEAKYNVRLPQDVLEYFLKINGISYFGGFIALEAIDKWGLITDQGYDPEYVNKYVPDTQLYIRFGNYDISVWDWLIQLDSNPNAETPIFVLHEKFTKIANSFSDFLQKFRTDSPEDLLGYS